MEIKIKLYTILKKYSNGKTIKNDTVILQKDTTLQELSRSLNIPEKIGKIFLVNDSPKDKEYMLHEGDEVKIFSLICGG